MNAKIVAVLMAIQLTMSMITVFILLNPRAFMVSDENVALITRTLYGYSLLINLAISFIISILLLSYAIKKAMQK